MIFSLLNLAATISFAQQTEASRPISGPGATQLSKDLVKVPMKLIMNRPTLEVRINGKGPYAFVLDTGAGTNVLDPALADELNLESTGITRLGDPASPNAIEAETWQLDSISVGDVTFENCPAVTWDAVNHIGVRGIIGLPTFFDVVISMDYPNEKLTISEKSSVALMSYFPV